MRSVLVQPWITVSSQLLSFTQDEEQWVDCSEYADVAAFWIDVSQVALPSVGSGSPSVTVNFETSPSHDESYFQPVTPAPVELFANYPPTNPTTVSAKGVRSATSVPLSRWLRWRLSVPASASGTWSVTFRVRATMAKRLLFQPTDLAGCVLWLRPDMGIALGSEGGVATWADQSMTGDSNKDVSQATGTMQPAFNASDANFNGQPSLYFQASASQVLVSGTWSAMLSQPDTWVVVAYNNSGGPPYSLQSVFSANDDENAQSVRRNATPTIELYGGTGPGFLDAPGTHAWSAPGVVLAEFNGANTSIYFNNLTTPLVTGLCGSKGMQNFIVGGDAVGEDWTGGVAEIFGYSRLLSSSEKSRLRAYLNYRYAFSPPVT
jgi:hypothetical protein